MNFKVVPKAGIDTGIESVREILRNAYSMRRNARRYLTLRATGRSGTTSAAAGKTNLSMTPHRTVPIASVTSQ
jgi:hypothetical protein